jgi:hypothetical protein
MASVAVRLTLLAALFITACVSLPSNPEAWMEREVNACLPTAIAFREGLRKYQVWAEVVRYSYHDGKRHRGHAITAYLYPKGKNQLWTYDSEGSYRTHAFTNNPTQIAQRAHAARLWQGRVYHAEFVK